MKVTQTFDKLATAYNEGFKMIAMQGGQGSSKTYSTMQLLLLLAQKKKKRHITVCSYALPHLKNGAMKDLENILVGEGYDIDKIKNKSDQKFHINNSIIEFIGIEGNPARVTGTRRDILYINEANNKIAYEVFDLADSRTHECTIIDFNPRAEFWYHTKVQPNFKTAFLKSNFMDNEHLPERELQNILSKKNKKGFENWWRVYGEGEVGLLEDAAIKNWRYGDFNNTLPFYYGLDFGFNPDPDVLVKVAIDQKAKIIYVKELFRCNDQSFDALLNTLQGLERALIVADSAEPRIISDLKRQRLNIVGVIKGAGSIKEGLRILRDYEIIVDAESTELGHELMNYCLINGEPIDGFNHGIDALRYVVLTISGQRQKKGVRKL